MRTFFYLIAFVSLTCLFTACQVQPQLTPTSAYLGTYTCTLTNKTTKLTERNELVETKTYVGKVTQTAERSVQLNLTTSQGNAGLTMPLVLTDQGFVVRQFETNSSATTAGTTTYWANYYTGSGQLVNQTLSVELNSANYQTIGANGSQTQLSASDVTCNCIRQQGVAY